MICRLCRSGVYCNRVKLSYCNVAMLKESLRLKSGHTSLTLLGRTFFFLESSLLSCMQPFRLLGPIELFTPCPYARDAEIPIELLDRIQESLIGRHKDVSIFSVCSLKPSGISIDGAGEDIALKNEGESRNSRWGRR